MSSPAAAQKPPLTDPRSFAFVLVGTALPILIALIAKSWAGGRGETVSVGPLGVEACLGPVCAGVPWDKVGLGGSVSAFGVMSVIGGIAAIAVAAIYGGLVLGHKQDKLPPFVLGHAAFGFTAFAMLIFTFRLAGKDEVALGWGPFFGLGGIAIAWMMLRRIQKAMPARGTTSFTPVVAPMGGAPSGAPSGAPMGGAPMGGAPMGGAPMGGAPMGGAPMGASSGAPMSGAPMGGSPMGSQPPQGGAPLFGSSSAPSFGGSSPSSGSALFGSSSSGPSFGSSSSPSFGNSASASKAASPISAPQKCPSCGGPLEYVAQYQRSWCAKCARYA